MNYTGLYFLFAYRAMVKADSKRRTEMFSYVTYTHTTHTQTHRSRRSSRQRWRWTSPAVTRTCSPVSWIRTSAQGSAWFNKRIPRTNFGISPNTQTNKVETNLLICLYFQFTRQTIYSVRENGTNAHVIQWTESFCGKPLNLTDPTLLYKCPWIQVF